MFDYRVHAEETRRLLREIQSHPQLDRPDERRRRPLRRALRSLLGPKVVAAAGHGTAAPHVTIRSASTGDRAELADLARVSERRLPAGPVLIAEIDEEIVAALPLEGGPVLVDVLRPTADVVQLLELRSEQVRRAEDAIRAA